MRTLIMGIYTEICLSVTVCLKSDNDGHFTRFQTSVVVSMGFSFFWAVRLQNNPEERRPQCTHFLNTYTCSCTHLKSKSLIFIEKIINKIIAKYWNLQGSVTYFLCMIHSHVAIVIFLYN